MDILIVKLSAIGDVVHSLPFLEVLRDRFPEAHIDWFAEAPAHQIVEGHPEIRRVLVSPRKALAGRCLRGPDRPSVAREVRGFLSTLRAREYDMVIDLQGLLKSGVLTGLSKGKRKIGMSGSREGARLFFNEPPVRVNDNHHAIDRYLTLARHLGCRPIKWEGKIPVSDRDRQRVGFKLRRHGIHAKVPLIVINPVAKWETKLWDPERFAVLADKIKAAWPCELIFTGSDADRGMVEGIIGSTTGRVHNFAGETNLKELAVLYEQCRLVISTDTGPMHMAAAMGCPVVALFGPTAPWRTGPYGGGHHVVREPVVCSPCLKKRCHHMTCMKEITPDQVFKSVKVLFERVRSGGAVTGPTENRKLIGW